MTPLVQIGGDGPREKVRLACTVNGDAKELLFDPYKTLLEVLREDMGLIGTKHGCELGECGACAVLLDGQLVLSCLVAGIECEGRRVETVEGMQNGAELHPLQATFADHGAAQCGYCTPGFLLAAKELLEKNPKPTRGEIAEACSGQLCRCTGYLQIFEAIEAAACVMRGEPAPKPKLPIVYQGTHPHPDPLPKGEGAGTNGFPGPDGEGAGASGARRREVPRV